MGPWGLNAKIYAKSELSDFWPNLTFRESVTFYMIYTSSAKCVHTGSEIHADQYYVLRFWIGLNTKKLWVDFGGSNLKLVKKCVNERIRTTMCGLKVLTNKSTRFKTFIWLNWWITRIMRSLEKFEYQDSLLDLI